MIYSSIILRYFQALIYSTYKLQPITVLELLPAINFQDYLNIYDVIIKFTTVSNDS